MSIEHPETSRPLPDRPNLRHLKDQARDLLEAGAAASITDAPMTAGLVAQSGIRRCQII